MSHNRTITSPFAIIRRLLQHAPVAQLDRVLVSEAKGRGFDSRRARHIVPIKSRGPKTHGFLFSKPYKLKIAILVVT